MSKFSIYSKDGASIKFEGCPQYNGTYLGVPYIEFANIESPTVIDWTRGDYVDYYRTGLRYKLYDLPEPKKQARPLSSGAAIVYSGVRFYSDVKELEIAPFRDILPDDNNIHFSTRPEISTYEDVYGIARRIQACVDDIFPNKWKIEVFDTNDQDLLTLFGETKEYTLSNGSCLDALSKIYETWKNVGWYHTYDPISKINTITIGRTSVRDSEITTDSYAYGVGNGLTSIKKASANKEEFATRLFVFGSERNLPARYYNGLDIYKAESVDINHLMIPTDFWGKTDGKPDAKKAYIEADAALIDKYGLIPRTVYFDGNNGNEEIYPSIQGLTQSEVRKEMIAAGLESSPFLPNDTNERIDVVAHADRWNAGTKEDMEKVPTFLMYINQMGFDLIEAGKQTSEGKAILSMKSGMCAGREFAVKRYYTEPNGNVILIEVERQWDESLGLGFPNTNYPISDGDEFVVLDIPMPAFYIGISQKRLLEAAQKKLADYTRVSAFYEPSIDSLEVKRGRKMLREGMYMQVHDEDIIDTDNNTDFVLIDSLVIDEKGSLPIYRVTLREQKRAAKNFGTLEEMIEDAKHTISQEIKREKVYNERRFRAAQETMSMIESAFENFSDGINPVTVRTMAMLVGDESLQFIFTDSRESLNRLESSPLVYDSLTKQINSVPCALIHMTLGINEITAKNIRSAKEYMSWDMEEWHSEILEDKDKSYYVYAIVERNGQIGTYCLSENPLKMEEPVQIDGFTDTYNLLVGILNSEYADTREFIPLHGFTEVLPGQITTDVICSANGSCYFDLANNEIGGAIKFLPGTSGIENLGLEVGGQNMLRNSGFTGDYLSEQLADDRVLTATDKMFNPPLVHWDATNVEVVEDAESASGYAASMTSGSLKQTLSNAIIAGETYVLSFKAKGTSLLYYIGKHQPVTISLTDEWKYYSFQIKASFSTNEFEISGTNSISEVQLERGTVATGWSNSPFDNRSDRAYYQALEYLASALEGSTIIDGGLVLTRDIRVGNYANQTMTRETGGMRGVWNSDDDVYQWGGGNYNQAVATVAKFKDNPTYQPTQEELKAMANYVVTHGGLAILNNAIVRGTIYSDKGNFSGEINATQGSIGGFKINYNFIGSEATASGMSLYDGFIRFTDATSQQNDKKAYYGSGIGVPGGWMTYVYNHTTDPYSQTDRDGKGIYSSVSGYKNNYAFYCPSGVFAGLRPNIRVITDSADATLTEYDHTIITSVGLTLPSNPQKGQTYRIWFDGQLSINEEMFYGGGIIDVIYTGTEWKMFHSKPITTD